MTILTMKTVPLIIYIIFQNSACSMFVLSYLFQEVTLVIPKKILIPMFTHLLTEMDLSSYIPHNE
jgi:hypothetical protein